MRMGVHAETLSTSFADADRIFLYQAKDLKWNIADHMNELGDRCRVFEDVDKIVELVGEETQPHDYIVIMSNGAFGGIYQKLIKRLNKL
jgi:UDP-N-acetylmuramate: L-alanyl-gamma-D-glutamyl-meso-diaminopimelate ligase